MKIPSNSLKLKFDNDDSSVFEYEDFQLLSSGSLSSQSPLLINATDEKLVPCQTWTPSSSPLLKLALFVLTVAFVIPHKHRYSAPLFRSILSIGLGLYLIWGLKICSPDILFWNSLFFGINIVYLFLTIVQLIPIKLNKQQYSLYKHLFKIYKVKKNEFQTFINAANTVHYASGDVFACEQITMASLKLSLLIKGRFVVSYRGSFMYDITPYEFLDCNEWVWQYETEDNFNPRFQVTLTATEDCTIMTWSDSRLHSLSKALPRFYTILCQIVAKNALEQLYSVIETKSDEIITTKLFTVPKQN